MYSQALGKHTIQNLHLLMRLRLAQGLCFDDEHLMVLCARRKPSLASLDAFTRYETRVCVFEAVPILTPHSITPRLTGATEPCKVDYQVCLSVRRTACCVHVLRKRTRESVYEQTLKITSTHRAYIITYRVLSMYPCSRQGGPTLGAFPQLLKS
jgi:hypothetical protein